MNNAAEEQRPFIDSICDVVSMMSDKFNLGLDDKQKMTMTMHLYADIMVKLNNKQKEDIPKSIFDRLVWPKE